MAQVPAHVSALLQSLQTIQKAAPPVGDGDFLFLKLAKSGDWIYGADETEVDPKSEFVIDPSTYISGFIAWDEGELMGEEMAMAGSPPVTRSDLKDVGGKWAPQEGFALKGVEGKDSGAQLLYKASSRGGRQAIAELLGKIIARGTDGETELCPIVMLKVDSYRHKKYGKIYTPVLDVIDWMDLPTAGDDDDEPEPVKEPEPAKEPEPKKRTRRARAA